MVAQEMYNATNCGLNQTNITMGEPLGETDSFGGGGAGQFGGYDGKVHKPWGGDMTLIKTDKSILNPNCEQLTQGGEVLIGLTTLFFALAIVTTSIFIVWDSLKSAGKT
jgi:hypothetical protein